MDENSFFNTLKVQYKKQLPFVVYSRPINSKIKCWLQKDAALHNTETFTESGFVFAPFNLKNQSIIFPKTCCECFTLKTEHLEVTNRIGGSLIEHTHKVEHLNLVLKGVEAINNAEFKKVVLSRVQNKSLQNNNPITIFKRLFNAYKNAMVYCWYHPKVGLWLGATPELLFKIEGKQLTTISLAGTQAFKENDTPKWSAKEVEEQQIVTDFIANEIKVYSKQVNVSDVKTVRAGNLWHLKTKITSLITDLANLRPIIKALHPTPAVCGYPKQKAKDFILQNENYNREYYTGFLGELNLKQTKIRNSNRQNVENNAYTSVKTQSNFYVNLRCMQLIDNNAMLYVGGGITKDSVAESEWEETINKTKTIGDILD
ncbi:MAG: chorismate-binding protein [Winogradskyella sp.]